MEKASVQNNNNEINLVALSVYIYIYIYMIVSFIIKFLNLNQT